MDNAGSARFGQRAKEIMREKGLSQSEVARRINRMGFPQVQYQHVQHMLNGKLPHDRKITLAFFKALELTVQESKDLLYLGFGGEAEPVLGNQGERERGPYAHRV